MGELLRPEDLKKISDDADMAKAQQYLTQAEKKEEEQKALREAFMARELHPQARERFNVAVRRAAEQGLHEIQAFTFPASYCNDQGRRINNNDPDWPESLEGFAKRVYEIFERELKPLGYKLAMQILDYPGGMPGNVGVFFKW